MVLLNKFRSVLLVIYFSLTPVFAATVTTTRTSETVDLARLSPYVTEDYNKLRLVWEIFRKQYIFTDDGFFEPIIADAAACPDNPETQTAFLHHVKEKSTEVIAKVYIRCGDCNGTGKKYLTQGDSLNSTAFDHVPCAGTGKIEAIITYRLIYGGTPPPRLPSKNQRDFAVLEKRVAKGDKDAEFELAQYYDAGRGTTKDPKKATELFTRCLMRKDPRGAFGLGGQYERGNAITQSNFPISVAFYMLGQSLGGGSANLENIYRIAPPRDIMLGSWYGRIVVKEFKSGKIDSQQLTALAIRQLAEASSKNKSTRSVAQDGEQELQDGMALLAGGDNQKPNYLVAHKKFIQAASCGQPDALYCLGVFYDNGLAVTKNKSTAYVFYKLAATIAGEDYMKISEKTLAPLCRSDENEAAYKLAFEQISKGKISNDKFAYVTSLKDIEDAVTIDSKPTVPSVDNTPVAFIDSNNKKLSISSNGSGLIFSNEGYFFTNNHVVEDGKNFTVKVAGLGQMRKAKLVAVNKEYDLAILKIENWNGISETGQPVPSLLLNSKDASVGSRIFTVGYPMIGELDASPKYTSGDLSSLTDIEIGRMVVTCPIQPGNSGGPVVREDGQVVGVICSTMGELHFIKASNGRLPQGLNFAVRIEYLRQLAERNSIKIPAPSLRVINPHKVITDNTVIVFNWQ
jgi:S1-C subfamily serine protease/TPR repeat protein